ncbi:MAG: hypothetical protein P1U74_00180 [Legionellaceae bacterium]|nr:hypothetical protein [Legionellaceae bacterium]
MFSAGGNNSLKFLLEDTPTIQSTLFNIDQMDMNLDFDALALGFQTALLTSLKLKSRIQSVC